MPNFGSPHFVTWLIRFLCAAFFAILFLQSGLDKLLDWKGNLSYHGNQFAKSPLKAQVPLLLGTLTVLEVATGVLSALGVLQLLINGNTQLALYGAGLAGITLLCLFFGQRIAKDYAGAAGLVPYFLVALAALYLLDSPAAIHVRAW